VADELERQLEALRPGDHVCQLFDSPEERLAAVIPFLRHGLAAGQRCFLIAAPQELAEFITILEKAGIAVERERQRTALLLVPDCEFYLPAGRFDASAAIAAIRGLEATALAEGFAGVRGIAGSTWALVPEVGLERLLDYEVRLNDILPGSKIVALCQYDRRRFEPAAVRAVLRCHPLVLLGDQLCPNSYYEPPHLIRDPAGESQRVEWMLSQLRRAHAVDHERDRLLGQLHTERARLEAIVQQIPAGLLIAEAPDGRIIMGNAQSERISQSPVALDLPLSVYRGFKQFYHPDGRPYHPEEWPLIRALNAGEQISDEEMAFERADGSRGTISVNGAPILDAAGKIVASIVVFHDVTARKQTEAALRVSEARYRQLFERNLAAVYRASVGGRLLDCNTAFAHILGYASREEALRLQTWDFYFHPADREAFVAFLQEFRTLTNYEIRLRRKDGSPVWILENTSLLTDADGQEVIEGTFVDITQRKQAEEDSYVSAARYRSLIENLTQGIFLKDRELRFVVANRPYCDTVGCPEAAVVGKTDFDFYPHPQAERYQADDLRVLARGERVEREERLEIDGRTRTYRIIKTPVQDERGHAVGVLGIWWDVTEQQTLESQLRQAQKMEAVGLLAGGIAHDFNNLLAVIVGNIALSLAGVPEEHGNRELLQAAERAGVQAAELTNQLLGFSRQTILRPVPSQLQSCMDETVRLLRRTIDPRIALEVKAAADLWTVEADPNQISQVLINLCLNARDAIPESGLISLQAENAVIDADYVRQHVEARRGDFVRLRVSDTGAGIPTEIRPRIFEPFFTTKGAGKGTGLGLAMVFGIVQQHQGWIECASEVGQGTRFDIYLPRHGTWTAVGATPAATGQAPRGGTETILLADDEPMIRNLGRTILQRYGYRVLLAEDGLEAVDIYREKADSIDLVILDLTMPRLSGLDAFRQLQQFDPGVRVVFASGYSAQHLTPGHHERIAGFISKPFRPEKLAQTVREALDRARNCPAPAGQK